MLVETRQTYNPKFDTSQNLDIRDNLKSLLGERFNVLISTTRYGLRNGQIVKEGRTEPFINAIKRGRDYKRGYPDPVDYRREDAEVIGFQKIQDKLGNSNTPVGTMMTSISPPGPENSAYQKNFYDIFTKTNWGIEARRYSSALTYGEYAKFYLEMGFNGLGETADDAFFLENPIVIADSRFKTAEDLHRYLYREHQHISVGELERIWRENAALASIYLKVVASGDPGFKNDALDAFINGADLAHFHKEVEIFNASYPNDRFYALAMMPVREVKTGCGTSGGYTINNNKESSSGPASVSEYGEQVGVLECVKCIFCKETVDAILTQKKIICPKCGKSADRSK